MVEGRPAPEGVDPSTPNVARVYDYMLGGKDNYEVDRQVAQRMLKVAPDTRLTAWFCRQFLIKITEIAAEAGVDQYVDLGAGIPTSPAVHEVARKYDADARVAFVDYDPVVYAHANAMLAGEVGVTPMLADVRRIDDLIARLPAEAGIDFARPVAIVIVGVLHYIMDDEGPAEIIARLREAMAPGSYLGVTHASVDTSRAFVDQVDSVTAGSTAQCRYRTADEVTELLDGFDILAPGIVPLQNWLDDELPATGLVLLGGVCRRP
ncbi:SAM-dependent methyltransferase [Nocardia pseudobrasiliensis]|uniref:S-adenosyl methyltransferase n=1 Tax=Nocardia pseudobrasiliensis TaxID=45979 RepID=A0A370IEU6_9NOCA|nr:SAM-dependent methyltransferase [Nocardia pseudobrasiliensis]RDI69248.1 S-adenosyl methyltransferase [Nocardia pseudobrasiliensis]